MNRPQMVAAFAEEELRTFKGRGGKIMTFIEDETVMDRLDAGYGFGNWQILVEPIVTDPGVVKVRLGVRESGEWVWYEDFGYPNQPDGDVLKEAVSDGIRRCGRYVGIARDLYRKSTYEPGGSLGPPAERNPRVGAADYEPPLDRSNGGLIGTAEKGTARTSDYELRQSPKGPEGQEGPFLGFRLKDGRSRGGQLIEAWGPLAEALAVIEAMVIGQRVQVWGHLQKRDLSNGGSYQAFVIEKIVGPEFTLPAGPVEPESLPLFDPDIEAELDAAIAAA